MKDIGKYVVMTFPGKGIASIIPKERGFKLKSLKFVRIQAQILKLLLRKNTPIAIGKIEEYVFSSVRTVPVEWLVPWPVDEKVEEEKPANPILDMSDEDIYNS